LREVGAHRPHLLGERHDAPEQRRVLEVPEDVVAVVDRLDARQRGVEEGLEVVLLAVGRDRSDDLVQVQVTEESGLRPRFGARAARRFVGEDAAEGPGAGSLLRAARPVGETGAGEEVVGERTERGALLPGEPSAGVIFPGAGRLAVDSNTHVNKVSQAPGSRVNDAVRVSVLLWKHEIDDEAMKLASLGTLVSGEAPVLRTIASTATTRPWFRRSL
jgi:hypothetical protein